jgi:uncharacterized protein YndB with AHSA1/START domain
MPGNHVATSTVTIDAAPDRVWKVITDPAAVKEFMFGADVVTDWTVGGPIAWRGEWAKGMWDMLVADVKKIAERS